MARIESTHRLTAELGKLKAGELKEFLGPIDDGAIVKIRVSLSDRPGEISSVTVEAEVDIYAGRIY